MVVPSQPSTSAGDALMASQVPAPTEDTLPTQAASPSSAAANAAVSAAATAADAITSSASFPKTLLVCGISLLLVLCVLGLRATVRSRRRRLDEEAAPLLKPRYSTGSSNIRAGSDVASIGSPARDFVRLSSLPPATLRSDERGRRCMACDAPGDCVALRPCGHRVLCRKCSDFVHACPHCGQYISGVSHVPNASRSRAPPGLP